MAGFLVLGLYVTRAGEPAWLFGVQPAWVGHATSLALLASTLCRPIVLVPIGVALLLVAWRAPAWRGPILFSLLTLVVSWLAADVAQRLFGRPRRLDWVVKRETAFSYPSSHAAIVAGFYGLWAGLLWTSQLSAWTRRSGAVALLLTSLAILWSRLALGAHYISDLIGGVLLGAAIVACAGAGLLRR